MRRLCGPLLMVAGVLDVPYVAATFEPDAGIDYLFVGPPREDGLGQVLDAELFRTKPVGGVQASYHFGVLAMQRAGPGHADRVSVAHGQTRGRHGTSSRP